jgi:hypothetical protein
VGDDVEQVERTLHPGEELVRQETARGERIGLIIRPPAGKQQWIVFFMESADRRRGLACSTVARQCRILSGGGYYIPATVGIDTLDQVTLIGWSLGSTGAIDVSRHRDVRAQILLSPMTSLLACAIDLTRIGETSIAIGPFGALSRPGASTARLWNVVKDFLNSAE